MPRGCTTSVQGETTGAVEFRSLCDLFDRVFLTITRVKKMPDSWAAGWLLGMKWEPQFKKDLHSEVQAYFGQPYSYVGSASFDLRPLQCSSASSPLVESPRLSKTTLHCKNQHRENV